MMSAKKAPFQTENESWKPSFFSGASCSFSGSTPWQGTFPSVFHPFFHHLNWTCPAVNQTPPQTHCASLTVLSGGSLAVVEALFTSERSQQEKSSLVVDTFLGGDPGYPKCSRRFFRRCPRTLYSAFFDKHWQKSHLHFMACSSPRTLYKILGRKIGKSDNNIEYDSKRGVVIPLIFPNSLSFPNLA